MLTTLTCYSLSSISQRSAKTASLSASPPLMIWLFLMLQFSNSLAARSKNFWHVKCELRKAFGSLGLNILTQSVFFPSAKSEPLLKEKFTAQSLFLLVFPIPRKAKLSNCHFFFGSKRSRSDVSYKWFSNSSILFDSAEISSLALSSLSFPIFNSFFTICTTSLLLFCYSSSFWRVYRLIRHYLSPCAYFVNCF